MKGAGFRVERRRDLGKRNAAGRPPAWAEMDIQRFNVRVYFFLLDRPMEGGRIVPKTRVLLSDEFLAGQDC